MRILATTLLSPFIIVDIYTTYRGLSYFFRMAKNQLLACGICFFFSIVFTGLLYFSTNLMQRREARWLQKCLLTFMAIIWIASFIASFLGLIAISGNGFGFTLELILTLIILILLSLFCSSATIFLRVIHESCSHKRAEAEYEDESFASTEI